MKLLRRNLSLLEYIYIVWSLRFQLHEIYRKKRNYKYSSIGGEDLKRLKTYLRLLAWTFSITGTHHRRKRHITTAWRKQARKDGPTILEIVVGAERGRTQTAKSDRFISQRQSGKRCGGGWAPVRLGWRRGKSRGTSGGRESRRNKKYSTRAAISPAKRELAGRPVRRKCKREEWRERERPGRI